MQEQVTITVPAEHTAAVRRDALVEDIAGLADEVERKLGANEDEDGPLMADHLTLQEAESLRRVFRYLRTEAAGRDAIRLRSLFEQMAESLLERWGDALAEAGGRGR